MHRSVSKMVQKIIKKIYTVCDAQNCKELENKILEYINNGVLEGEFIVYVPCLYNNAIKSTFIKDIKENLNTNNSLSLQQLARQLIFYAPLLKHQAFASEKEWRIVIYSNKTLNQNSIINVDNKKKFKLSFSPNCIKSLTIGACKNFDKEKSNIEECVSLIDKKLTSKIHPSSIPYRNW